MSKIRVTQVLHSGTPGYKSVAGGYLTVIRDGKGDSLDAIEMSDSATVRFGPSLSDTQRVPMSMDAPRMRALAEEFNRIADVLDPPEPEPEPEPEPVLGYCMADPHRNGRGKRCAHYRNKGCINWLPEDSNEFADLPPDEDDDFDPDDDVTGYNYIVRVVGSGIGAPYNVRLAARGILRGMGYNLTADVNDIQKREIDAVIRHIRGVIDGAVDI